MRGEVQSLSMLSIKPGCLAFLTLGSTISNLVFAGSQAVQLLGGKYHGAEQGLPAQAGFLLRAPV